MRQPREHQVPCQEVGCKSLTFHWSARCDKHVHRCTICRDEAEISYPDKHGDPVYYCQRHQPGEASA
jgi:hypothetical protein